MITHSHLETRVDLLRVQIVKTKLRILICVRLKERTSPKSLLISIKLLTNPIPRRPEMNASQTMKNEARWMRKNKYLKISCFKKETLT